MDIENAEFGIVNNGDAAQLTPVELKDHSLDPVITEPKVETPVIEKKKRGRPKKVVEQPMRQFRCSTCREIFSEKGIMKIGTNDGRYAAFCPMCQRSLGFVDEIMQQKVQDLIKNNPTK